MANCADCGKPFDPSLGTGDLCPACAEIVREQLGAQARFAPWRHRVSSLFQGFAAWRVRFPAATLTLLVVLIACYFLPNTWKGLLDLRAAPVFHGEIWRLVTCGFLHYLPMHLVGNLVVIALLGLWLERTLGCSGLLTLVLVSLSASSAFVLSFSTLTWPYVGASGIGFAMLGTLFTLYLLHREALPSASRTRRLLVIAGLTLTSSYFMLSFAADWLWRGALNRGHLGGLVAGLALGAWLPIVNQPSRRRLLAFVVSGAALVASGYVIGRQVQGVTIELDEISATTMLGLNDVSWEWVPKLESIVARHPENVRAHFMLGQAYGSAKRYDDAAREYEITIALVPDFTLALFRLGNADMDAQRYKDAVRVFARYTELEPQDQYRYDALAHAYHCAGNADEAIRLYEMALQVNPQNISAQKDIDYLKRLRAGKDPEPGTFHSTCPSGIEWVEKTP